LDDRPQIAPGIGAAIYLVIPALVFLWAVTHHYGGLKGDAGLYAVQASARIHANLANDLYLRNTSQDSYTIFSDIYAGVIRLLGLQVAAMTLFLGLKLWFFAAAWRLSSRLFGEKFAPLTVALLIASPGEYGAFSVFHYAEDWLTARSFAEALVITSVACYFRGWRSLALLIATAALFVHPLMALPGILVLACLLLPPIVSLCGAVAGVVLTLAVAFGASKGLPTGGVFTVMDATWVEVVRERSQFLFLQLWRTRDWALNTAPFLSLSISGAVINDERVRKLAAAAMLVGAAGIAVALIGSLVGPISFLLQGQAWRWMWLPIMVSNLLLAPTAINLLKSKELSAFALLFIASCAMPAIGSVICLSATLLAMGLSKRTDPVSKNLLRLSAPIFCAVTLGWMLELSWRAIWSQRPLTSHIASAMLGLPGPRLLLAVIFAILLTWTRSIRSSRASLVATGVLLGTVSYFLPRSLVDKDADILSKSSEFENWREVIPPNSNVFVVPAHNSPAFAWFILQRPSYLTVDQSSGVVFSRDTAMEVRRRSQVLLPLMKPDWRLLSDMNDLHMQGAHNATDLQAPLTPTRLIDICADPLLNFVISPTSIGFDPYRHVHPGIWRGWSLYDCRAVASGVSSHE
jgi:hypothetical protein